MKLEFLREGSPDCPLIRLYEFDPAEARQLQQAVVRLVRKMKNAIALHRQEGIEAIGGCELTLCQSDEDKGVRELTASKFEWRQTNAGWLEVAGLIQPFCLGEQPGHQWLTRSGQIAILLSRDGSW